MGNSVSVIPFLVVVLFEVMMGRMNGEVADEGLFTRSIKGISIDAKIYYALQQYYPLSSYGKFELLVSLVEQNIVFLENHTVTVGTVSGEDEETSSDTKDKVARIFVRSTVIVALSNHQGSCCLMQLQKNFVLFYRKLFT